MCGVWFAPCAGPYLTQVRGPRERRKSTGVPKRFKSRTPSGGKYFNLGKRRSDLEHFRMCFMGCSRSCAKTKDPQTSATQPRPIYGKVCSVHMHSFAMQSIVKRWTAESPLGLAPLPPNLCHLLMPPSPRLAFKISYWNAASPLLANIFFATRFPLGAPDSANIGQIF